MNTKEIQIRDYNYPLPDERIAKFPLPERDSSKLLVYKSGEVSEDCFRSLPQYLPKGALMVFNNTKVIRARLHFRKLSTQQGVQGALIEVFLLEPASPIEYQENFIATSECSWYCLVGNSKKWKEGLLYGEFQINGTSYTITAERVAPHGTSYEIRFRWEGNFAFSEVLESLGELPIPPYLNRKTEESDLRTYQTVYSKIKGSVAAPTAGLHFTERVLTDLDAHGIEREELTLHVGAGTFKPVKSEEIGDHEMHTEHIAVRLQTIQKLIQHDGKAIAVGTTILLIGWLICMLFPHQIARIFTTDPTLIEMSARGIRLDMLVFPIIASQAVITNFFQCIGKVKISIFLSLSRQLFMLLPLAYLLPLWWQLDGVWYSMPFSDFGSFAMTWPLLLWYLRKFKTYAK